MPFGTSICFPVSCYYRIVAYLSEAICQFPQYLQVVGMFRIQRRKTMCSQGFVEVLDKKYNLISEYLCNPNVHNQDLG